MKRKIIPTLLFIILLLIFIIGIFKYKAETFSIADNVQREWKEYIDEIYNIKNGLAQDVSIDKYLESQKNIEALTNEFLEIGYQYKDDIISSLFSADMEVKLKATVAAGILKLNNQPVITVLLDSLKGNNKEIFYSSIVSLGQIGNKEATSPLLSILGNSDSAELKVIILRSLQLINDKRSIHVIVNLLGDENTSVRAIAQHILVNMKYPEVKIELNEALSSDNVLLSENVKVVLERIADKKKEEAIF